MRSMQVRGRDLSTKSRRNGRMHVFLGHVVGTVFLICGCGLNTARATITVVEDEATWQAALPNRTLIDFDGFVGPVSNQFAGVTFSSVNGGSPQAEARVPGNSLPNELSVGDFDTGAGGGVAFTFDVPRSGVGFWYADSQFAGNAVDLYDIGGGLLASYEMAYPHPAEWLFVGFLSTSRDIAQAVVTINGNDFVPLDDLQFGDIRLPGDANEDGCVSGADFTIWADNFDFGPDAVWGQGDFTGDGFVTGGDFTIWADHFGLGCAPSSVPEPGTAMLLAFGAGLLCAWGHRAGSRLVRDSEGTVGVPVRFGHGTR